MPGRRRIIVGLPPPVLQITLPLPPSRLSANRTGASRAARSREVHAYREQAGWVFAGEGRGVRLGSAVVRALFFWPVKRQRDSDNALASLKPAWDGMQDAGVVTNDVGLTHLPAVLGVDKAHPRVELEVFDIEIRFEVDEGHRRELTAPDFRQEHPREPR